MELLVTTGAVDAAGDFGSEVLNDGVFKIKIDSGSEIPCTFLAGDFDLVEDGFDLIE